MKARFKLSSDFRAIFPIMKWFHSLKKSPAWYRAPHKGRCGYYSITPEDLPILGAVKPRGKAYFTLTETKKSSNVLNILTWVPTTGFALEFPGFPSLRFEVLIWNHNQVNQTQKLPPGAQTAAWIGRLFPQSWLLVWPYISLSFIT